MPGVHICPVHGPEPCPGILPHACRDDAKLTWQGPRYLTTFPLEVG